MATQDELLDDLMKNYKKPEDLRRRKRASEATHQGSCRTGHEGRDD